MRVRHIVIKITRLAEQPTTNDHQPNNQTTKQPNNQTTKQPNNTSYRDEHLSVVIVGDWRASVKGSSQIIEPGSGVQELRDVLRGLGKDIGTSRTN